MMNGIDIASHQKELNLNNIKTDFVIIKATGGTQYVNPYCDIHYQQAKKKGLKRGVYHYAREKQMSNYNAVSEAEYFVKNIKGYINDSILCLDYEEPISGRSYTQNDVNWCLTFLNKVKELTGVKCLIYINTSTCNSVDWSSVVKADYGLWLADYNYSGVNNGFTPNIQTPKINWWKFIAIYQYASDGRISGYPYNLDMNVFYGDNKTWDKYIGVKKENNVKPNKDKFIEEIKPIVDKYIK